MSTLELKLDSSGGGARGFTATHWSVVLAAGNGASPNAAEALNQLCRTYWYPLYAFVRQKGRAPAEAQDLTQEFFTRLLERNAIGRADPARGRFRSFLLTALDHFLASEWRRARAQKRGGGVPMFSLDEHAPEERYQLEPAELATPERIYERRWIETLLERVLIKLRDECNAAGRGQRFGVLKPFLVDAKGVLPLTEAAQRLDLSLVAVKGVVHRLRERYGEIFREEIAHTLADTADVDDEIRHLLGVLSEA